MNGNHLKFGHLLPEFNEKLVDDGIKICCECGSLDTIVLTRRIYCIGCRSFRTFKNREFKKISPPYEQFDDDD